MFLPGAILLGAFGIEVKSVLLDGESAFRGDFVLPSFDLGIEEFHHLAALEADQMVVVAALVHPSPVASDVTAGSTGGLGAGLLIGMWNFMGWDNASTFAGEVERPERTYPRAMVLAVIAVTVTYLLPLVFASKAGLPASHVGTFTQSLYDEARARGWTVISIRNDWKRVFAFD